MSSTLKKITDTFVCQLSHWKNRDQFNQMRSNKGDYSLEGFDRLRCIYIHIPKAAGISINQALFGNYGGGHKTVRQYKRIFGPCTYKKYFTFTFVRNPYSRLFSAYQYLLEGGFKEDEKLWADKNIAQYSSFDDFVLNWLDEENIWSYNHFKPQYSFVCDIGRQPEVNFIGKVETINQDFNTVCKKLNIPNKLKKHNESSSSQVSWQESYSEKSLLKVTNIYQDDFERFNYNTEVLNSSFR